MTNTAESTASRWQSGWHVKLHVQLLPLLAQDGFPGRECQQYILQLSLLLYYHVMVLLQLILSYVMILSELLFGVHAGYS